MPQTHQIISRAIQQHSPCILQLLPPRPLQRSTAELAHVRPFARDPLRPSGWKPDALSSCAASATLILPKWTFSTKAFDCKSIPVNSIDALNQIGEYFCLGRSALAPALIIIAMKSLTAGKNRSGSRKKPSVPSGVRQSTDVARFPAGALLKT
jgi:hypothetical protein